MVWPDFRSIKRIFPRRSSIAAWSCFSTPRVATGGCWSLPIFDPRCLKLRNVGNTRAAGKTQNGDIFVFEGKILNQVVGNNGVIHIYTYRYILWRFLKKMVVFLFIRNKRNPWKKPRGIPKTSEAMQKCLQAPTVVDGKRPLAICRHLKD